MDIRKTTKDIGIVILEWGQSQFLKDTFTLVRNLSSIYKKSIKTPPLDWEFDDWMKKYINETNILWTNAFKSMEASSCYIPQKLIIDPLSISSENINLIIDSSKFRPPIKCEEGLSIYTKLFNNNNLFNGELARISNWDEEKSTLTFQKTYYFDYISTNLSLDSEMGSSNEMTLRNQNHGDKKLCTLKKSKFSNVTGVNGLVFSNDGYMIFQSRNSSVLIRPGQLSSGFSGSIDWDDLLRIKHLNQPKLSNLDFLREMTEELGVSRDVVEEEISERVFLGLTRELVRGGAPELFYSVDLKLSKKEILERIPRDNEGEILAVNWGIYGKSKLEKSVADTIDFPSLLKVLNKKSKNGISIPFMTNLLLWMYVNCPEKVKFKALTSLK